MKKIWFFMILVLVVISLSACPQWGKGTTVVGTSFIGGKEGLSISFASGEPPERVLDEGTDSFFITIVLENLGEDTVEFGEAVASLSGISGFEFDLPSLVESNDEDVLSRRKDRNEIIAGGVGEIRFGPASYMENIIADVAFPLRADVCYLYTTKAISSLCLKRNAIQRATGEAGEACLIDSQKDIESSGAPITVNNFRQRAAGLHEVRFTFDVVNVGSGESWAERAITLSQPCTESIELGNLGEDRDVVYVSVRPTTGLRARCAKFNDDDNGEARLSAGTATGKTTGKMVTIACTLDTSGVQDTAFESPLNIYVDYAYKDVVTTRLLVEDALAGEEEIGTGGTWV